MAEPILWKKTELLLLDQRLLPKREEYLRCLDARDVAKAIKEMAVRGAPAIGIAAAFGVALEAIRALEVGDPVKQRAERAIKLLGSCRPTARNLFWALERMEGVLQKGEPEIAQALEEEALRIWQEDIAANRTMGRLGAKLLPEGARVLTHCNAGALATGGYGTALGVIRSARERGRLREVFATETRPLLQGARLTAWELSREGIPVTLVVEGAVGHLMARKMVDAVVVGADRITSRGDVANKIGTYPLAVMARRHGVPFYVVAPSSTFDLKIEQGSSIPIEERDPEEVLSFGGKRIAPEGVRALNPAFDVTPAELVSAIITERGVIWPPLQEAIARLLR